MLFSCKRSCIWIKRLHNFWEKLIIKVKINKYVFYKKCSPFAIWKLSTRWYSALTQFWIIKSCKFSQEEIHGGQIWSSWWPLSRSMLYCIQRLLNHFDIHSIRILFNVYHQILQIDCSLNGQRKTFMRIKSVGLVTTPYPHLLIHHPLNVLPRNCLTCRP